MKTTYDLSRFTAAHQKDYEKALCEIRNGKKRTHWMWYIFPQIQGLGDSVTTERYAIQSEEEARAFLSDPYLGKNLLEISNALLLLECNDPYKVFEYPDTLKLRSSMTLFAHISEENSVFHQVLDKYYNGTLDTLSLSIIKQLKK